MSRQITRHILVVDDDGDVRDVILEILVEHGFDATAAPREIAMRAVLAEDGPPINAVVLDSLMPGKASAALALLAKMLRLPLVMISGSPECMRLAAQHGLQLLHKPFRAGELIEAIECAIASGQFGQRDTQLRH